MQNATPINKTWIQELIKNAHVPAVSCAYVMLNKQGVTRTNIACGKKNGASVNTETNAVDEDTQFPASSLSKIVFTYLVLQLVKDEHITLDEPLHAILKYERFRVNGDYPEKAKQLTARHILSHTTGLPNWGPNLASPLPFDPTFDLGKGYSYSGEAFLYLQKAIEKKMGRDLEVLAKEYVFVPLKMERTTFLPQVSNESNIVEVHTALGKTAPIQAIKPPLLSAASLLTTANDFSKFLSAWLVEMENDPIIKQAFKSPDTYSIAKTCGLGWHFYKDTDALIAYQYGANPNTRSFVAINVTHKVAAAFFTNSENGMSIATQILHAPDLPHIGDMRALFKFMGYGQSDEPGWQETMSGKIAEADGRFEVARACFENALALSPHDVCKQRCLQWFNEAHRNPVPTFTSSLEHFVGDYNHEVDIHISDGHLIYKRFDKEIKLVRVADTEFLPEKDQTFKISFNQDHITILYIEGYMESFTLTPAENTDDLHPQERLTSPK